MKPEINDIVTIKLDSGEEIVGKLAEHTSDSVRLANPLKVATPGDVTALLNSFVTSVNGSLQTGLGHTQDMMSTVNNSGLDNAHAHISDIVTNMPSSATMINKANEIGISQGMPPSPPLEQIYDPIVNGGLNNTFAPVKGTIDDFHAAVTGPVTDSINAILDAAQYVFDRAKVLTTRSGLSFHPPVEQDVHYPLTTLSVHPTKSHDDVIHDYLQATKEKI